MTYTSPIFLGAFLPLVIIIYSIVPQKKRWIILLAFSYIFFWAISSKLIVYLLITTLVVYGCSLWINSEKEKRNDLLKKSEKEQKKIIKQKSQNKQKLIVLMASIIIIGMLIVLKYSNFFCTNINNLFVFLDLKIKLPIPEFLLPIGISFYSLQAISYLIDIYKEKINANKNIWKVALFLCFFPQLMEGPICRYDDLSNTLFKGRKITYESLTFGVQRILYGVMKKFLIVDRLNPAIIEIFDNYSKYDGGIVAIGMIFYTIQLYMDFSGVMDIVIGTAEIFGIKMPENFKQPFFSKTISEFWTRWHITLGTWFRDYIYYPVSLTKKCKNLTSSARKKLGNYYGPLLASTIALFCVWICNGLWHGSAWSYIFFGIYHFSIITIGRIIEPLVKKTNSKLHINNKLFIYKFIQILRTTILVFIGELFFRAKGLRNGLLMFKKMINNFSFNNISNGKLFEMGIDMHDIIIVGIVLIVILIISLLKEKKINIRKAIANKNILIRWAIYYALMISIVLFGTYGLGIVHLDPIYANF